MTMYCGFCSRARYRTAMDEVHEGRDIPPGHKKRVNYTLYRCPECSSERKQYHHAYGPDQIVHGPFDHEPERRRTKRQEAMAGVAVGALLLWLFSAKKE